jgi:hypothetical protein
MRIAFDLDNTLIRNDFKFQVEEPYHLMAARLIRHEKLRKGTKDLITALKNRQCEIWIYTTSYRSPWYLRKLFWLYGIRLDGIVNQEIHNHFVKIPCTKYPPQFGIDVLVDDSAGVGMEGKRYNFRVINIDPNDEHWTDRIMNELLAK